MSYSRSCASTSRRRPDGAVTASAFPRDARLEDRAREEAGGCRQICRRGSQGEPSLEPHGSRRDRAARNPGDRTRCRRSDSRHGPRCLNLGRALTRIGVRRPMTPETRAAEMGRPAPVDPTIHRSGVGPLPFEESLELHELDCDMDEDCSCQPRPASDSNLGRALTDRQT